MESLDCGGSPHICDFLQESLSISVRYIQSIKQIAYIYIYNIYIYIIYIYIIYIYIYHIYIKNTHSPYMRIYIYTHICCSSFTMVSS